LSFGVTCFVLFISLLSLESYPNGRDILRLGAFYLSNKS